MKRAVTVRAKDGALYARIRKILESARAGVARSVNTAQVAANWMIGREIVEEEQQGKARAGYAEQLVARISGRLGSEYGTGYSIQNLWYMRQFYAIYPELMGALPEEQKILHAVRGELRKAEILHAVRGELAEGKGVWKPGEIHKNLSWTHYRTLLRVERDQARAFYEIEAVGHAWSARELERQIDSLLFERLAKSRDKKGVMKLATQGHSVAQPGDVFKDPMVIEFLGLPESHRLVESNLEQALIDNLQAFLLEPGKGFAFVSRQKRITLDGDHFYVDLVFYHTILKCYVLIDLKVGKLTHGDLGQMQFYANYFDRERRSEGDNPTLGLIMCSHKNEAVVRYTLAESEGSGKQTRKIFTSRYQLHLPSEEELRSEMRREMRQLAPAVSEEKAAVKKGAAVKKAKAAKKATPVKKVTKPVKRAGKS